MTKGLVSSLLLLCIALSGCATKGISPDSAHQAEPSTTRKEIAKLPPDVPVSWWQQTRENLRQAEYQIGPQVTTSPYAFQAPNRANNLRTFFNPEGIHVVPRTTEEGSEWTWGLRLDGYGRGEMILGAASGMLGISGNRAENVRGDLTEWYINDSRGLEHGFTLRKAPRLPKKGDHLPLVIRMKILGELQGEVVKDEKAVNFNSSDGVKVLSYCGLKAFDADGKSLPATLKLARNFLNIVVDDSSARYPVTIDPLLTSPSWTAEGDQTEAKFGWDVASAGDVNGDGYDDVIVGAPFYDDSLCPDEGRAFVYHGSASGLSSTADWTAHSSKWGAKFGLSVSTAGDVNGDGYSDVIVGAPSYDIDEGDEGRAYVYYGSATGLSPTADWIATADQAVAHFGQSVGTAGDVNGDGYSDVIVGAYSYDNGGGQSGRVYIYHGSTLGLDATAAWTADSEQTVARFGWSVSTAGDVNGDGFSDIIVGASFFDNGEEDEGRAYVYHGSSSGLSPTAAWTAESDQEDAYFGYSVSTAGDVNGDGYSDVIVGAYKYDGNNGSGCAYVYHGSASGVSLSPAWAAEGDVGAAAKFGGSVGTAGDVNGDGYDDVIIGAYNYSNGQTYEGKAYVYQGSITGLALDPSWSAEGDQAYAIFGYSANTAGDVNGDGYSDIIVGAYDFTNELTDEGRAYVYYGGSDGSSDDSPPSSPTLSYSINGLDVNLNWTSVAGATGYRLYYSPYPYTGPDSIFDVDVGEVTNFSISLWNGAAFYVAVQAYNALGNSDYSNIETIIISP